jgi:hypothetical protein
MPKWLRDLLLIPLGVGLVVAFVQFALPNMFSPKKEISYKVTGPINQIGTELDNKSLVLEMKISGEPINALYSYKIDISNTGGLSIKDLPIKIMFTNAPSNFRLYGISHKTKPEFEFGEIKQDSKDNTSVRFIYQLLNKSDSDEVNLFVNTKANLNVYAKQDGLKFTKIEEHDSSWVSLASLILAVLSSFVSVGLKSYGEVWPRIKRIFRRDED